LLHWAFGFDEARVLSMRKREYANSLDAAGWLVEVQRTPFLGSE
jgi:hypothetical protein